MGPKQGWLRKEDWVQSPRIYTPTPFLARAVEVPHVHHLNTSFRFALDADKAKTFCQPNRFFGSIVIA